ncbi:MAG: hypothetical protein EZS28_001312 [Streblomastix strix]|uniref:Right handed beta helix domain-containing protein n=1 Tax=Streblomastix strix TaxID=222440 RepID=A0A5J4X7E9_9EUKA|nr:MAG: hypothetical protein EZS28_001312 [Streblomastix strix]
MLITSQSDFYASAETIYLLNRDYTSQPTLYINENQPTNEYIITNCTFTNSRNQLGNGGALNIQLTNGGSASAKNVTISDCQAINGGAIYAEIRSLGKLIIEGSCLISNCTSQQNGGGINCIILDIGSTVDIIGSVTIYNCSSSGNAGGLYVSMNSGLFQCNNMYVQECKSLNNGGGIYIDIINGGELILDNGCQLIQCISEQGNGGAIYIDIDFEQQSQFKIKDALIQSCEAKYNSQSNSPTGYGGGIFLVGSVNFDVSQRLLDFHGLKTNGNLASYNGQSLYVVMAKIDSWCKQGNYGEYVKGNYSNSKSSLGELQGIATSFGTFSKMTIQQISALTQHLQLLWSQSAVVTKVSAIINQNNIDAPLLFIIEGHGMISGQFYVKLFEIRDKTEEEIEQDMNDNKQSLYNNNQNNSIKSSIKTNSQLKNDKNSYHCNEFELIWPDNDGTGSQIAIDGSPQGQQTASFGMKDAKWYNYQKKLYGILGSNDGVTFTGVKGKINKTVLLQTQIEKETHLDQIVDEQPIKPKGTGIPTWVIILIILIILLLVCVIITNGLYYFFRWWNSNEQRIKRIKSDFAEFKNQHENNKQQLLQYPDTNKEQFSGKLLKGSSFLFKAKSQKQSLQHQSEIDQLQKKEPYQKFPPSPIPNQIPESAIQTPPPKD